MKNAILKDYLSDEGCKDERARSQYQLQAMAKQIRKNCKVTEIKDFECYVCTIYENENLGIRFWVKDEFGHIIEIDEERNY